VKGVSFDHLTKLEQIAMDAEVPLRNYTFRQRGDVLQAEGTLCRGLQA
jgi:hypothetical protein